MENKLLRNLSEHTPLKFQKALRNLVMTQDPMWNNLFLEKWHKIFEIIHQQIQVR